MSTFQQYVVSYLETVVSNDAEEGDDGMEDGKDA